MWSSGCAAEGETSLDEGEQAPSPIATVYEQAPSSMTMQEDERIAWERVASLREDGMEIRFSAAIRHVDGPLAYLRVRKTEAGKISVPFAIGPAGEVWPLRFAEQRFEMDHQAQWGPIGLPTARLLRKLEPEERGRFHVLFNTSITSDAALTWARAFDPEAHLVDAGRVELRVPAATVIGHLRDAPFVEAIHGEREARILAHGLPTIPLTAWWTNSDRAFTANGILGGWLASTEDAVNIGIMEAENKDYYLRCRVAEDHPSFAESKFAYRAIDPIPCSSHSDCEVECGRITGDFSWVYDGKCRQGVCVNRHTTQVAGQIAAAPFQAAQAKIHVSFVAGTSVQPSLEWFASADGDPNTVSQDDVLIVNMSAGYKEPSAAAGNVLDWYARFRSITIVKTAGNRGLDAEARTDCLALNAICVGGVTEYGWGLQPSDRDSHRHLDRLWASSTWRNPDPAREIEKPDVVSLAHNVDAPDYGSNLRPKDSGTSLAAPMVTAQLALLAQACGVVRSPAMHRAILRTSAVRNARIETHDGSMSWLTPPAIDPPTCPGMGAFPRYPNPTLGCDYRGGCGRVDSDRLVIWCGTQPEECTAATPCTSSKEGAVGADDAAWGEIPEWARTAEPEYFLDNATQHNTAQTRLRQDPDARWIPIHKMETLKAGTTIAASLSYYACPPAYTYMPGPLSAVKNNLDLALCGRKLSNDQLTCLSVSESLHDSNEGFEITLPEDFTELYYYLIGPAESDWQICTSSNGGSLGSHDVEPWALAIMWWG